VTATEFTAPVIDGLFSFRLWCFDPMLGHGLPLWGFAITLLDTSHVAGFLWTSDDPDAETSTWQYTIITTDKHPCPRWDSKPQSQQASGLKPTP